MEMLSLPPPPSLGTSVVALWALRGLPIGRYTGLPKPYAELVVSLSGRHYWYADLEATPIVFDRGWFTPVQAGPRYAETLGGLHLVGARLCPIAAARLFGSPARGSTALPIPLDALLGADAAELRDRLLDEPSDAARLSLFGRWLGDRLEETSPIWLPPASALHRLRWRTDALADALGLSPRGLRKRFAERLGLSPKLWLQLSRFDALIRHRPSSPTLADLAAAFDYADQAHMSAEFARFAGAPPGKYARARAAVSAPDAAPHFLPAAASAEIYNPSVVSTGR